MPNQMLTQILDGIAEANRLHLVELDPASEDARNLAETILEHLSQVPAGTPAPTVTVLPEATPVAMVSGTEIVAMLAASAGRFVSDERVTDYDWAADPEDFRQFRQFLFKVQDLFGVRVRVRAAVSPAGNFHAGYLVAGRSGDRDAFRLVMQTFHDLGAPIAAGMTTERREQFWATLGDLVAASPRAAATRESAARRFTDATDFLRRVHGPARTLPRAEGASNGDPIYAAATGVLADAATRL